MKERRYKQNKQNISDKIVEYVHNISFIGDVKIIIKTAIKVFKREGISGTNSDTMQKFEGNKEKINV